MMRATTTIRVPAARLLTIRTAAAAATLLLALALSPSALGSSHTPRGGRRRRRGGGPPPPPPPTAPRRRRRPRPPRSAPGSSHSSIAFACPPPLSSSPPRRTDPISAATARSVAPAEGGGGRTARRRRRTTELGSAAIIGLADYYASSSSSDPLTPVYLSTLAGMSTCLGAAAVFLIPPDPRTGSRDVGPDVMAFSLALAGSVMITVSAISIGPECMGGITSLLSETFARRLASFGCGCGLYLALSRSLPDPEELVGDAFGGGADGGGGGTAGPVVPPFSIPSSSDGGGAAVGESAEAFATGSDIETAEGRRAWRVATLLFVSLMFHNFPEGLAVAASSIESDRLGLTVAAGIMIHNIPEGVAIAVPSLAARPDRPWTSFALASASGLAEPLGALAALTFLRNSAVSEEDGGMMPNVLAFVAGIMVTVAAAELLPEGMRQAKRAGAGGGGGGGGGLWSFALGAAGGVAVMTVTESILPH